MIGRIDLDLLLRVELCLRRWGVRREGGRGRGLGGVGVLDTHISWYYGMRGWWYFLLKLATLIHAPGMKYSF
jgi:hypothetical protein